jgi:NAD(P)-dependent dehydrogenase (short-subunit alcohol dehydrogenase family)
MYLERFRLDGRVAVVTGGAQAIGLACVEALSEAGAHVYIIDRDPEAGAEAQGKLAAKGIGVDFIEMDVTNSAAVDQRLNSWREALNPDVASLSNRGS